MGALTEYYVDPVGGNDTTGTGAIGAPWATVQKALNTITRDATNGDRINLKDSGDDVLSAALSFATYGNATADAPLVIQGYTSAAGDGGIGGISGGGSVAVIGTASGSNYNQFIDLHLHNCGAANIIDSSSTARNWTFARCELDNTTGIGLQSRKFTIIACHIHNIGSRGVQGAGEGGQVLECVFENGTNDFVYAIDMAAAVFWFIGNNIISIDGSSTGIHVWQGDSSSSIINNTIYSNGGTGKGILFRTSADLLAVLVNNYVEGFSGAGGVGIDMTSANAVIYGHNKFYNNTTHQSLGDITVNLGNNDTLGSSALTAPGSGDFSVSTALKATGWPTSFNGISTNQYLDVGAAQRQEAAAGGILIHPGMRGGING